MCAGLEQYDPGYVEATKIEAALNVPVLRHKEKKPAGGTADIEARLGCAPHETVMIGDRYLTDVFFGNRSGMLSIRVAPFVSTGESVGVRVSRFIEESLVTRYNRQHIAPPDHPLLASTDDRVKLVKSPGIW
jgi:phosphatidylglycerophosphatase GEP4